LRAEEFARSLNGRQDDEFRTSAPISKTVQDRIAPHVFSVTGQYRPIMVIDSPIFQSDLI
jgi:hypothetical protein